MKTLSGMVGAVTIGVLSIWLFTPAAACVADGQVKTQVSASSKPETPGHVSDPRVEKVTRRIETLKAAGVQVTEPAEGSFEPIDIDSLPKQMREITLVTSSQYSGSSGFASWNLVLADGATRVELALSRAGADEPFMLLAATVDGQRVFASHVDFQESAASAFEVGNTYEYVDPAAARAAFDTLMLGEMETVLSGNVHDGQAPRGDLFAPLEPAAALGLFVNDEGATLFFDEEGVLLLVNRGEQMVAVLTAEYMPPTGGGGIDAAQREADEGARARIAVPARVRVCQRLFNQCLTNATMVGLRACELWLQYCAPKNP